MQAGTEACPSVCGSARPNRLSCVVSTPQHLSTYPVVPRHEHSYRVASFLEGIRHPPWRVGPKPSASTSGFWKAADTAVRPYPRWESAYRKVANIAPIPVPFGPPRHRPARGHASSHRLPPRFQAVWVQRLPNRLRASVNPPDLQHFIRQQSQRPAAPAPSGGVEQASRRICAFRHPSTFLGTGGVARQPAEKGPPQDLPELLVCARPEGNVPSHPEPRQSDDPATPDPTAPDHTAAAPAPGSVTFHLAITRRPRLPRAILDNSSHSSAVSFNTCFTDMRSSLINRRMPIITRTLCYLKYYT